MRRIITICDGGAASAPCCRERHVDAAVGLRLVRPDPHQLLAEIGALQQPHEGGRRAVETLGDEFLVLDLALAHPLRHVAQEVAMARGEIADDEAADGQALGQHRAHHLAGPFRRCLAEIIVFRDQAADRHARERIEQREHRVEHRAADILEIDVDALQGRPPSASPPDRDRDDRGSRRSRARS